VATLTEKREKIERERLLKLAESYKNKGYKVILNPSSEDLPDFLNAYQPDMVVHRGNDSVAVEVKSRFSLAASSSYLRDLAEVIEQHPDWRLELVVANSEETAYFHKAEESLQIQEIASGLQFVRQLSKQNMESAILYAWSLVEATLRLVAEKEKLSLKKMDSLYLIGQLTTEGIISSSEHHILTNALSLRNAIAHGFKTAHLTQSAVQEVINVTEQLLHDCELGNDVTRSSSIN
jgi:uncharacterized protein YutE (UPF0331/DUF86 family)